jgi:hypothetical protein
MKTKLLSVVAFALSGVLFALVQPFGDYEKLAGKIGRDAAFFVDAVLIVAMDILLLLVVALIVCNLVGIYLSIKRSKPIRNYVEALVLNIVVIIFAWIFSKHPA